MALRALFVLLALLISTASAQIVQFSGAAAPPTAQMQVLKVGAGGWVRGIDIQCDQGVGACNNSGTTTKVIRTDTYGAYVWNASKSSWVQLVNASALPVGDPMNTVASCINAVDSYCGAYEIRIAPSNTQIFYMMLNGYVYKTINQGAAWTATGFSRVSTSHPNDNVSQFGPKIAIDPANPDNVIVCTQASGCFKSTDGATSFAALTGVTNAGSIGMLAVFDPSSTSGGSTPGFYISSYGTGVYHCTGGLASPSCALTTSTPTTHTYMYCGPDGTLYLIANAGGSDQSLHVYTGGTTWTTRTGPSQSNTIAGFAVDPAHSTYASNAFIVIMAGGGFTSYSTNSGASWSAYTGTPSRVATDIPWLAATKESYMTTGQIVFDPAQSNKLFFSEGIGVWTTTPSTSGSVTFTSQSVGIEQLVSTWIISPPSGNPIVTSLDRPVFTIQSLSAYPVGHGIDYANAIIQGSSADWATSSSTTIAVVADQTSSTETSGYSTNGGGDGSPANWTKFSSYPSGSGWAGGIAAASSTNFVWAQSNNGGLFVTQNSGTSWTLPVITGVATSGARGWGNFTFNNRQIVCADRVNSGTFYAYNGGSHVGSSTSTAGIYKTTDGGTTWARVMTGNIDSSDGFNAELRCVPGNSGDMFYSSGNQTPGPYPHTQSFYECTDSAGTVTCSAVANIKEVWAFGFGAPKPAGSGFPAIYIYGWVSNVPGLWRSDDHAATWTKLSDWPINDSLATVAAVEGDANTYGIVYIAITGNGWAYYHN